MIEKILERARAELFNLTFHKSERCKGFNDGIHTVIKIVQEVAKEYGDGWIPVETELPPMPKENPLFENKPLELYLATVKGADYPFRAFWNGKFFTDGWGKVEAIAWMPLPPKYEPKDAPYQKGE